MTNETKGDSDPANSPSSIATLQEYTPHPYQSLNSDGEILVVNEAWIDTLGYDRSEVEGRWFGDFLPTVSADEFDSMFTKFKSNGHISNVEYEMRCADGDTITVSYDGTIEYDDTGDFVRAHCQFTDITGLKERDRELQIQSAAMETSIDGMAILDENEEYQFVNEAHADIYGYDDPDAFIGETWRMLYDEDEIERLERRVFPILDDEGDWRGEAVGTRRDGSTFPQQLSLTRLDSGEIVCVVRDVTTRKHRLQELEKYHAFVEHSQDLITVVDETGRIQFNSPAVERVLGYGQGDLLEKNSFELVHPDDRDHLRKVFQRDLILSAGTARDEFRVRHADGSWVWIESVAKNRLGDPNIEGVIINQRDISERKEYEQELEQANDQLQVLNRVLRHDIRNDMSIVLGWGKELKEHVDEDGEQMLNRIQNSSRHVIDLTKTLRDFMKVYGYEEDPELTSVDIGTSLENEIRKIQEQYPSVVVDDPDELPAIKVRANELIATVFWNLLQNAIKHNDKEVPKIEIGVEENEETVTILVADNGPGIPEEQRDEIFGKGESGLEDPEAGIGLYLVDTVVTQYGGDVWVEENEPEGAILVVELPKADSEGLVRH